MRESATNIQDGKRQIEVSYTDNLQGKTRGGDAVTLPSQLHWTISVPNGLQLRRVATKVREGSAYLPYITYPPDPSSMDKAIWAYVHMFNPADMIHPLQEGQGVRRPNRSPGA